MNMYVGITDLDWYQNLHYSNFQEINFWKPGAQQSMSILNEYDLFLFKLHSPNDFIVGGGFFLNYSVLPTSIAWDVFEKGNGTLSWNELLNKINKYKRLPQPEPDPVIGCITLTSPFFFDEIDWIPAPINWSKSIVQGKRYQTEDPIGKLLYQNILLKLRKQGFGLPALQEISTQNRYGMEQFIKPRLGQGAFKVLITEAYHKRCAITGEKTLPVLQAAHIKPYSFNGPHAIQNGMLLRQDIHTLFDRGFITIDPKYTVIVSSRIKDEYGNGKEYYAYHGKELLVLPDKTKQRPSLEYLNWHNQSVFIG